MSGLQRRTNYQVIHREGILEDKYVKLRVQFPGTASKHVTNRFFRLSE